MLAQASRRPLVPLVTLLLFGSGFCALAYQIAWLRMLRLVFGASTAASAAVLAIFMGGLGFGGLWLGRRADRVATPLRLYATLELGVAFAASLSPLLIVLVRTAYIGMGGTARLGLLAGTALRLVLSALVLGVPTFLMGGTLPAAVRAAEHAADAGRRRMGLLYGANTLGAVAGALWATFVSLELLGTNRTVWVASLFNGLVALAAFARARTLPACAPDAPPVEGSRPPAGRSAAPVGLVLAAAAVVGFAFLLMELVWYRMLAPLLGGSSYTFGLILCVALLGIGVGGLLYAVGPRSGRPTLMGFAATCALEALLIVVPYALGDWIAVLAAALRSVGASGFVPLVGTWLVVCALVVFPASIVAGYQFPLLVGLLGSADQRIGREVGLVYASNTIGAIVGCLAGGFGLIPLLTAPGTWRGVVLLLVVFAAIGVWSAGRVRVQLIPMLGVAVTCLLAVLLCVATGPTAFWRHTPIGAGRLQVALADRNGIQHLVNDRRRSIVWERDGVESTVALDAWNAYAFIIQGKSDGNAIGDAPTQVMAGILATLFQPNAKRALVIGLGTGSTAGWLAHVSSIERVDVVELEPAILHVATVCSPVNHDVLSNPKVHVIIGDGREFLLTAATTYDVIISEPSNPYRAGVAGLFTTEFYQAVNRRLAPGGAFAQWVQAYEIQLETLATVHATLGAVFPSVETWEVKEGRDLLLLARRQPALHDLDDVRSRLEQEPYRSALALVWGVSGAEGLYTAFVADSTLSLAVPGATDDRFAMRKVNTDDRTLIEFEFARTVGREGLFSITELRAMAAARNHHQPLFRQAGPDWAVVEELRSVRLVAEGGTPPDTAIGDPATQQRVLARRAYASGNLAEALDHWLAQGEGPQGPMDVAMVAEMLAAAGDARALPYIEELRVLQPVEAEAALAHWYQRLGHSAEATAHLIAAFELYRVHPWAHRFVLKRAIDLAWQVAARQPPLAKELFDSLAQPFAVRALDAYRLYMRANIGLAADFDGLCAAAIAPLEPYVPWERQFLEQRNRCYAQLRHPLASRARADLTAFLRAVPSSPNSTGSVQP